MGQYLILKIQTYLFLYCTKKNIESEDHQDILELQTMHFVRWLLRVQTMRSPDLMGSEKELKVI